MLDFAQLAFSGFHCVQALLCRVRLLDVDVVDTAAQARPDGAAQFVQPPRRVFPLPRRFFLPRPRLLQGGEVFDVRQPFKVVMRQRGKGAVVADAFQQYRAAIECAHGVVHLVEVFVVGVDEAGRFLQCLRDFGFARVGVRALLQGAGEVQALLDEVNVGHSS